MCRWLPSCGCHHGGITEFARGQGPFYLVNIPWWRHHGNISRITGPVWGESTGHRWIPLAKANDAGFWCFLWSATEQRLRKLSRRRWFETPSRSLWRHCNAIKYHSLQLVDINVNLKRLWTTITNLRPLEMSTICIVDIGLVLEVKWFFFTLCGIEHKIRPTFGGILLC